MRTPPPLDPSTLAGITSEYASIREIGSGGFKTVYAGERNGQTEVIKVIGLPIVDGTEKLDRYHEECLSRVKREVSILSQCSTMFLVKVGQIPLTSHEVGGYRYAVYSEEFLDGPDLKKIISSGAERPEESDVKMLMHCLLLAVQELWSKRYVHRDIKPANVIRLSDPARPFVLIDLGIAFGLLESGLTAQGVPCTLRYIAPEMAKRDFRNSIDFRSDLYTSALTAFEYASGVHPIARDADDPMETYRRAVTVAPKRLKDLRPNFSDDFCQLIDQLLKKKPALRPSNFKSLLERTTVRQ